MKATTKATQPKLQSQGVSTRGNVKEPMSNTPRGGQFSGIFYAGAKQPAPTSPGR